MSAPDPFMPDFWKEWLAFSYAMPYEDLVAYVREHGDVPVSGPMGQIRKILSDAINRDYVERLGKGKTVTFRKVD